MHPEPRPTGEQARKGSKPFVGARRGQKTLGWFLTEEMLEKTGSPSPPILVPTKEQRDAAAEKQRGKRRGGRRNRKLTESLSTASETSLATNDADDDKKTPPVMAGDFFVYDVASDGYYYEQNGAKGWRRRVPEGVPPPPKKKEEVLPTQQVINRPPPPPMPTLAGLHAALLGQNPAAYNRYYDPSSDGYFFEMASVDGWRKRTTQPPAAIPSNSARLTPSLSNPFHSFNGAFQPFVPASHAAPITSYGAALARGEMPAKCVIESSASSSVSDDLSYPSLSRPTSLDFASSSAANSGDEIKGYNHWDTTKFIEDLVGKFDPSSLAAFDSATPQTPATSLWRRRQTQGEAPVEDEDDEEYLLTKELEKIWQSPTAVMP